MLSVMRQPLVPAIMSSGRYIVESRLFNCILLFIPPIFVIISKCLLRVVVTEPLIKKGNTCKDCTSHMVQVDEQAGQIQHLKQEIYEADDEDMKKSKEIEELNKQIIALKNYIENILTQKKELQNAYVKLKESSDHLTSKMSSVLEASGNLETINDEFANTKLAERMSSEVYNVHWLNLMDELDGDSLQMGEVEIIATISVLLKKTYDMCVQESETRLRHFLFLDDTAELPGPSQEPDVYRIRRQKGRSESVRSYMKKTTSSLLDTHSAQVLMKDDKAATRSRLETLISEFTDCCWLMTISNPQIVLKFDVMDLPYAGQIKERYMQYATQKEVIDKEKAKDIIICVVWPSVEYADGSGFLKKGDVITVS